MSSAWQKIRAALAPLFFCAVLCSGVMLLAFSCSHSQTNENEGDEILSDSGDANEDSASNDQLSDLESSVVANEGGGGSLSNEPGSSLDPLEEAALGLGKRGGGVFTGKSAVPQIPGSAIEVDGAKLNRFYFVRNGDSPESVAGLLFNNPAQAKELSRWNPKSKWKPGSLIFYISPDSPSDTRMQSFYQERSVPVTKYTVAPGDWLSRIATKHLGSPLSWKEIAVVNGLESPDAIEKGQELALYPADLSSFTGKGSSVAANGRSTPEPTEAAIERPAPVEQPPDTGAASEPPSLPGDKAGGEEGTEGPAFNVSRALQDNMFAMGIGGVVLLLLVALLALNKKKKSRRDELGDDIPAPKMKRK